MENNDQMSEAYRTMGKFGVEFNLADYDEIAKFISTNHSLGLHKFASTKLKHTVFQFFPAICII